jgi:ATP-dependent Lhr-like helicase
MPNSLTTSPTSPVLAAFHAPVATWFARALGTLTPAQEVAWPPILAGETTLILAPTGSGKTLAAFLAAIDRLMFAPVPPKHSRCRVLYISPLKALAVDVERNLRVPLAGVAEEAARGRIPVHVPEIAIRTGDTPSRERARFSRSPDDILITTPESLFLLLTSAARETLRSIDTVIIDEIHTMVATKRGAHLALSLERLEELITSGRPLQRIGLSATVHPVEEAARFLGGYEAPPCAGEAPFRPVTIADARAPKRLDLTVEMPVEDVARTGKGVDPSPPAPLPETERGESDRRCTLPLPSPGRGRTAPPPDRGAERRGEVSSTGIWPAIHPLILDHIRAHRSTLIFVNSRRLAERMAAALNELAGEEIVRAHHGSLAREQRLVIEEELKAGRLPGLVATSSLELGIDMGAIDLVIQVETPPSVAAGLQRIGRAGHQVDAPSRGIILPKYRGDLLACAALTEQMLSGAVEATHYLRNPLDILAQQIVAMVAMDERSVAELARVIRRAAPFAELPEGQLDGILDMLSGRYPSDAFGELRARITWDRIAGTLHARDGARRVAITNSGTIPDRGLYGVFMRHGERAGTAGQAASRSSLPASGRAGGGVLRVGELDEEMVFESRPGDVFVLGASSWRIEEITHDRVFVTPAPGEPGRLPFWHGDRAGRPLAFGQAIGALARRLREMPRLEALELLTTTHCLTAAAAHALLDYLDDQAECAGAIPDDTTILVERTRDEMGDWRVCLLSPLGARVHAPWAMAIGARVRQRTGHETDVLWTDDGIVIRFPDADAPPPIDDLIPGPEEVEALVIQQLRYGGGGARETNQGAPVTAMFASRFREASARALLLPRRRPGKRTPLWQQRKRAADLLHAAGEYGDFPIVLETFRECLRDHFDMPALVALLAEIREGRVRVLPVNSHVPSPFAASLLFNYVANFMYEGDAPLAERRAQALSLDATRLRELLGEVSLRELIDPDALAELEAKLQHRTPDRKARHADALHDLLLHLGALTRCEIEERCDGTIADQRPTTNDQRRDRNEGLGQSVPALVVGRWSLVGSAATPWIASLEAAGRIVPLAVGGETRYAGVEDASRYRDALGVSLPATLPAALLEPVRDPLGDLVIRYARTHGPFTTVEIAARLGIGVAPVQTALIALEETGRLVQGEFRPDGHGSEWCDADVLAMLRQKSLARLRREVEPVTSDALGRFLIDWHGVNQRRGPEALIEVIEQIQGVPVPISDLESRLLPARIDGYDPRDLDALTTSGTALWVGCGALGQTDGRIALYLTGTQGVLPPDPLPKGKGSQLRDVIRDYLSARGASFFAQIVQACEGTATGAVLDALWELVWSGEVTNDTLQPLRARLQPGRPARAARPAARAGRRRMGITPPPGPLPETERGRLLSHAVGSPSLLRGGGRGEGLTTTAGRWYLVRELLAPAPPTERLTALTRQLLRRHGVLTREAVAAEEIEGGFSAVYPVLRAMEEAGQIRRGYFVAGHGALQFALPEALERLRGTRDPAGDPSARVLAADDPANPYGAALSWPNREDSRRPARSAGALVVLIDGAAAAWMGRGERHLLTFPSAVPFRDERETTSAIACALAAEVDEGNRSAIFIREVDGTPARRTPMGPALEAAGFTFGPQGYMRRA